MDFSIGRIALALFFAFGLGGWTSYAQEKNDNPEDVLGLWLTAKSESKIEIFKSDSVTYAGRIVWLKEPNDEDGKPKVDKKNSEDSLKTRPVLGLMIMRGFTYDGDNEWSGGKIYDPKSGNDYSAKFKLVDHNNMELRGYVVIPLFGRTEEWTRTQ